MELARPTREDAQDPATWPAGLSSDGARSQNVSVFQSLTHMTSVPFPATQSVCEAIQAMARSACRADRNCQTLYRFISRARDICDRVHYWIHVFNDDGTEEDEQWQAFDNYTLMLSALERIIEDCALIPSEESDPFGPTYESWLKNRTLLRRNLDAMHSTPLDEQLPEHRRKDLDSAFRFDDQSWLDILYKDMMINEMKVDTGNDPNSRSSAIHNLFEINEISLHKRYDPQVMELLVRFAMGAHHAFHSRGVSPTDSARNVWMRAVQFLDSLRDRMMSNLQPSPSIFETCVDLENIFYERAFSSSQKVVRPDALPSQLTEVSTRRPLLLDTLSATDTQREDSTRSPWLFAPGLGDITKTSVIGTAWDVFHHYCRARHIPFDSTSTQNGPHHRSEWIVTLRATIDGEDRVFVGQTAPNKADAKISAATLAMQTLVPSGW